MTYVLDSTSETPTGYETAPSDSKQYAAGEKYTVNSNYAKNSPVDQGGYKYTFSGWKLGDNVVTGDQPMGNSNVTLVGKWAKTERSDLSYTVNYLEKGTNNVLHNPKVQDGMTFNAPVTSSDEVIDIDGYNYDSVDKEALTIGTGENVINIYYTKKGSATFDFNDVDIGDGKSSHAITKTVTGNVGTSFTDKFEVIVAPKNDNAKDTMSDSIIGKANVTYSDRTKVAFDFDTNSKLSFDAVGKYTYKVQERKGTSDYMSYDTTEYTLTIKVDLNKESTAYEVTSWYFAGMKEYAIKTPLNITNTYYKPTYRPPTPTVVIPDDDALGLNTTDHFAYIVGYGNGKVRPQNNITRAETMTLVNRVLNRQPEAEDDHMTVWTDNASPKAWYYLAVQEATNSHYYEFKTNSQYEKWTELRETRDWTQLEK